MSCKVAVEQLLEAEQQVAGGAFSGETPCVGVARVGFADQLIRAGKMSDFLTIEMGPPLHSFVICAKELHPIEEDMYKFYNSFTTEEKKVVEESK